jgi:hypothetical protein
MLAKWANEVLWKLIAFVAISTNLAYISTLALSLRLRLYIFVIIAISHSFLVADNSCLCN